MNLRENMNTKATGTTQTLENYAKLLFLFRRVRFESESLMEAIECSLDYEMLLPLINIKKKNASLDFICVVEVKWNSPVNMVQDEL